MNSTKYFEGNVNVEGSPNGEGINSASLLYNRKYIAIFIMESILIGCALVIGVGGGNKVKS